jgi:adenosylcobinamide-GDP ribazoletransferase
MSFGMFSRVPVPHVWDETARSVMTLFLPIVGLVLGLLWYGLAELLAWLSLPILVTAAVLTMFPYLFTGFMHLDGFMDCCDAIMSRRTLEEKQRILKDSVTGTFAAVSFGLLLLISFALFASAPDGSAYIGLIFIPVAARVCPGRASFFCGLWDTASMQMVSGMEGKRAT